MKKIWNLLFVSIMISICFSSCTSSDTQWRDDNLAFFDNLKGKEGIHEIGDSINGYPGIFYQIINKGTGVKPIAGNLLKVAYAGWLWNDTTTYKSTLDVDDAFDSNDNFEFTLGKNVIDGWNIVIPYMPVGSKWRVYLPYYLGYGSSGKGTTIPAYSTLIFDIELKEIVADN